MKKKPVQNVGYRYRCRCLLTGMNDVMISVGSLGRQTIGVTETLTLRCSRTLRWWCDIWWWLVIIELHWFTPLLVNVIIFQGPSSIKSVEKIESFIFRKSLSSQVYSQYELINTWSSLCIVIRPRADIKIRTSDFWSSTFLHLALRKIMLML